MSSFGISGTNAHVILEQAPEEPEVTASRSADVVPLLLSAKTPTALRAQADALLTHLDDHPVELLDLGYTLARRARFDQRAVAHVADLAQAREALTAVRDAARHPAVRVGRARGGQGLAVLFSGQGSQRLGMGVELLRESAEFARAFDEVAGVLDPLIGIGLRDLVGRDAAALRETRYAQPALFAVETALYRLAEFHGVRPGFLIGHSIGEVAAAHVAGVLDLPDACALVAARGRLMQSAPAGGGMAAFAADEAEGAGLVAAADGAVELAAVNGPTSIVLAGAADALDRLVANWKAQGRKATRLRVSHAFHSTRMEPVLADFREAIAELTFAEPVVPVISSVTGAMAEPGELATPEYWVEQIRRPVRFLDALRAANRLGVTRFVEAGPDGSLAALVDTDPSEDTGIAAPVAVALLRPGRPEVETVRSALAELHVAGVPVDFGQGVADGQAVDLPVYPFETRRYWLQDAPQPPRIHSAAALGVAESPHPLLPAALELPDGVRLFTGTLTTEGQPWLADHRIDGRVLLPAAVLTELALAAGAAAGRAHVRELLISAPLEIHGGTGTTVQLLVTDDGGLVVRARTAAGDWQTHATGQLEAASGDGDSDTPLTEPQHWEELFDGDGPAGAYRRLAAAGYGYGSAFQGLQSARQAGSELEAEIEVPIAGDADRYGVHPALLDAALHAMVLHGLQRGGPRLVPYALEGVRLHRPHATRLRARLYQVGDQAYRVELSDPAGRAVLTVERLRLRALPSGAALHRLEWRAVPTPEADGTVAEQVELLRVGTTDPYHAAELARAAVQARLAASDAAGLLAFVTDAGRTADPHAEPASAALWGLVRAAQKENPGRFGLVHADRAIADELLATVALAHPQAVLTGAELRVPHAVRLPADVPGEPAESRPEGEPGIRWPRSADGGTVLITGGTGALGRLTARRLVSRHGVRNIVLVSRRGPRHPDAAAAVAELAALGAHAEVRACDLADRAAVAALIAGLTAPLSAVVHAAGIAQDTVVERLTADSLRQTLDAKTRAAVHLDELTAGLELDAFVLYGSVAGVFGTAGQAAYCAANASLEGIARRRRTMGRPALVLHWGLWALRTGLAAALGERDLARLDRAGIRPMAEADGLALLDRALRLDSVALIAAHLVHVEPEHRAAVHTAREVSARPVRTPRPGADPVRIVLEAVAEVLGHPAGTVLDAELAFTDLGIDSLTAVELRNRLNSALGLRLPSAVVFDHPNPVALAEFVAAQLELPPAQLERPEPTSPFRAALGTRDRDVADDPIAIVGMACRFPGGVRTPDEFWQLLADGVDAITEFPTDRGWDPDLFHPDPTHPGTSATRFGGFLHDAAEFDPAFFGISPREALAVDPQQRLLLETAWEAVESSGIDPTTLRGSDAGVFVGVMYADYGARLHQHPGSARELEGYLVSGSAGSVASGRIAYTLGLQGPAVTVDTACSSSLVALHQAAQALRSGECSLALVGGATVMASPATFVEFSRQQGLAADGRCKPFADTADGTAWGEGVGLLLVERLSDARRRGHQVLAVVRGSAVNQDGASNGLTAPNGPAQQRVIQRALDNAELTAAQVDVLQAHGTGTRLGDPIEAGAVLSVYGAARGADDPLLMGSVKSNIGHTQAAAGVAGIMAMVQAMRHGVVPGTLHLDRPSQQVDWSAGTVAVPTGPTPWPSRPGPRRAAVSSFGISGTNAHVILEGVTEPEVRPAAAPAGHPVPWLLSARTPEALREQAAKLREFVSGPGASETDVDLAYSLATTRTAFEHRAMVVGRDRGELLAGLRVLAEGGRPEPGGFPIVVTGSAVRGETAVLFTGQGSQRIGMGSALHAAFPVYARAFDEIAELFADREGLDLPALLQGTGGELDRTRHAQAALFAVEVALFRLLESWGLPGGPVAGHSIGELAAAHLAQALSLPDAVALVGIRGRLMGRLPDGGAMVAVQADPETVASTATRLAVTVDIAAINTPGSVVVSGAAEPVAALTAALTADGRRTRPLKVSHAFHSALMEPVLPGFRSEVDELKLGEGSLTRTVVSTLTGREASAAALSSADHWSGQLRGTVRFSDAVQRLRELGAARLLEIGPDAALTALVEQSELGPQTVALATLDRRRDDIEALWRFFAQAQIAGVDWDWRSVLGDDARTVPLPTYAFVHERLWLLPPLPEQQTYADGLGAEAPGHPLLAAAVVDPDGVHAGYTGVLSHRRLPWLADHALHGTPVLPAAALVDLLGWLADRHGRPGIIEISLLAPVVIADRQELRLRVTVTGSTVRVHAAPAGEPWVLHAEAQLAEPGAPLPQAELSPERPADALPVPLDGVYRALAERGYDYGPAFRGLRALWRTGTDTLYAEVDTADRLAVGLLDAALHAWPAAALGRPEAERDGIEVPASWHGITVHRAPTGALRVRMTRTGEAVFALAVTDVTGAAVLTVEEVRLRPLDRTGLDSAGSGRLYTVAWEAVRPEEAAACEGVAVVALDHGDVRADLREARRLLLAAPEQDHLVLVTTGAVAACPADGLPGVDQAALWGLVRTAQQEFPGRVSVIDTDGSAESEARLRGLAGTRPGQLALRQGQAYRPRLAPVASGTAGVDPGLRERLAVGTVLVTGAGGALGSAVARHLAHEYRVRRLLLVSRRGDADPALRALAAELADHTEVRTAACDLADGAAVRDLIAAETVTGIALSGVVHAAGVLDDAVLANMTDDQVDRVLKPKVDAARHLHELLGGQELAVFVLFSSIAGVLGNAGQGAYAAANAYLDALAAHRRAAGLPGTSLAWGLWESAAEGVGMGGGLAGSAAARIERLGIRPLTEAAGLELFDQALSLGPDHALLVPARLDRSALARRDGELPQLLADLVPNRPSAAEAGPIPAASTTRTLAERLAGLDPVATEEAAAALVRGAVAEVLGLAPGSSLPEDRGLFDLGLDSLTAIELRNRLGAELAERLPTTVLFDRPTVRALTGLVMERLAAARPAFDRAVFGGWVAAAADLPGDDGRRAEMRRALEAAIARLSDGRDEPVPVVGDPAFGMDSVSDDELFGLLDRELGD
ncbi:SDR family NAD(P)-dependent oxidoreductase [Kitasatospora sp. NPDC092948]|uniref:SDR family NAD(P)-dependent oxidoreductase n=1 Tax=Kitasatospora sp. NPDC092948 TaxID=3364088 RepID=UPI003820D995